MASLPPITQNRPVVQAGSGFTNLSKYLQANQSNQLGNAVAGGVQQAGQGARGAIDQAGQQFQTQLGAEKQRLDQQGQRVNSVLGNIPGATDEDVNQFANIRGGEYKGPTGVANADELRSKANEAETLGQAGGSEAGRFGLLQRFVGRGNNNYNLGSQRLDNMLLGQQGNQQLKAARSGTMGLVNSADKQINSASAQGQEGQGLARQLGDQTISKLGGAVTDYDTAMANQLASKEAGVNDIIKQFGNTSSFNAAPIQLSADDLSQLGTVSNGLLAENTGLYQGDYSPFIKINQLYDNKQGAQSMDDLAKAQMIARLSGNSLNGQDTGNTLQDYTGHPELAGQFDKNKFDVTSTSDLSNALNAAKKSYDTTDSSLKNSIAALKEELNTPAYNLTSGNYGEALQQYYAQKPVELAQDYIKSLPNPNAGDYNKMQAAQRLGDLYHSDPSRLADTKLFDPNFDPNDIAQARAFNPTGFTNNRITENENQIKGYQNTLNQLPQEFNVLRTLQKKPTV